MKQLMFMGVLMGLTGCGREEGWKAYSIDPVITVQLPASPREVNLEAAGVNKFLKYKSLIPYKAYAVADSVTDYKYAVVINTTPAIGKSEDAFVRDSLYTQGINTALHNLKQGQLLNRTSFMTPVGSGVEIKIAAISRTTNIPEHLYIRLLLAHHRVYSFGFFLLDTVDNPTSIAQRQRFFNSITVKP